MVAAGGGFASSVMGAIAAAARDCSRGSAGKLSDATDHAVLAMLCGPHAVIGGRAAEAIACSSGPSGIPRCDTAHAGFASCGGAHEPKSPWRRGRRAADDSADQSGASENRRRAHAHGMQARWGGEAARTLR